MEENNLIRWEEDKESTDKEETTGESHLNWICGNLEIYGKDKDNLTCEDLIHFFGTSTRL